MTLDQDNNTGWPTVLCGFGSVAAGIAKDKRMSKHFKYQTHAQVLKDHPAFDWQAVIEPDLDGQRLAREEWGVPIVVSHPNELPSDFIPEVAVLATPPAPREELLRAMPSIKAVVVEKPLGHSLAESISFSDYCKEMGIVAQVNFIRRIDRTYRELLSGPLQKDIGEAQAGTVIYGKGILNNGIHMIDLIRMLFGEITYVRALGPVKKTELLPDDIDIVAALTLVNGAVITMQPINFRHYRDIVLDVWGTCGRLEVFQAGKFLRRSPVKQHRALENVNEIAIDETIALPSYLDTAYYQVYDDLAGAINGDGVVGSSLENAIRSETVVAAIKASAADDGAAVAVDSMEIRS